MRGVLIFNQLNDVLFTKCDKEFADHIRRLAKVQGLLDESEDIDSTPSPNVVMQLFSPIVTSQRVMTTQFGNSYTSMKCQDGTNVVFDEYIGYTFVYIATEEIELMRRTVGVCVSIVRHVCGPDIVVLKTSRQKACLVSSLLDAWCHLRSSEQSILTEAVEQLSVNSEVASSILKVLHDACDKLRTQSEFANLHILILVGAKFLSLYSSKHAHDLCASDILLIILLCWVVNNKRKRNDRSEDSEPDDVLLSETNAYCRNEKTKSTFGVKLANPTSEDITNLFGGSRESSVTEGLSSLSDDDLYSQSLLLGSQCDHTANAVHVFELSNSVHLITIVESTNPAISSGLCDSFRYLNLASNLQLQRDLDELKSAVENLDTAIKKLLEGIRKNRSNIGNDVDMCQKRLQTKWDILKRKYGDLLRIRDPETILQIEANTSGLAETLRELLRLTCFDRNFLKQGLDVLTTVGRLVRQKLNDFNDFLKIWDMVEQSRMHLQEGHLSVMWKDTIFNYSYFLWFEDNSGWSPPKCKVYLNHVMKNFPVPGILCGDYYRKLTETCFPKVSPSKVRIHELYCVHLGLATSTCVLEHSRRLAATIWEVIGVPSNLADIF
ncbi:Hermansky-Pudlak syndrome 1 protein-like protein [Harpegnathos saltator]|uniref:Hermansky-Pudlak syndrome 1 protein-like protein n=1 Tax=Harpegnathos saltator TaxID=610380 RepID=E2C4M1_HARSA|nr:Hermansky-Pudlak syndrome 1 protein-like protein [Harpegnathos saltator]